MPDLLEKNGGLFIGINEHDEDYSKLFVQGCAERGIPINELTAKEALDIEPTLTPKVTKAFLVEDGVFDPLRLAYAFGASAQAYGAHFLPFREVINLVRTVGNKVGKVTVRNHTNSTIESIDCDLIVNAAGAWVDNIVAGLGVPLKIIPTPGIMVAFEGRKTERVINRLNEPDDGDILLPQRRMMVVGTTSYTANEIDYIPIKKDQIALMIQRGEELIPSLSAAKVRGVFMATRPLLSEGTGRSITRTFKCFDHEELNGVSGLVSVTGGKATTLRLMAEKTADLVCRKLGLSQPCQTAELPLRPYRDFTLSGVAAQ